MLENVKSKPWCTRRTDRRIRLILEEYAATTSVLEPPQPKPPAAKVATDEITPEVEADITRETEAEPEPEVVAEPAPEVKAEPTPEVEAEIAPEVEAEIAPEVETTESENDPAGTDESATEPVGAHRCRHPVRTG